MNHVLIFSSSGWCEKLGNSYEKGRYQPKTKEEFDALKKYASKVIEIKPFKAKEENSKVIPSGSDTEGGGDITEFTEERIAEIRAQAKEKGIKNWHSKKPENLVKELLG